MVSFLKGKENMNKLCRGCRYSNFREIAGGKPICIIVKLESEEDCPCINCLVKIICIKNCDKRTKKRREIEKR